MLAFSYSTKDRLPKSEFLEVPAGDVSQTQREQNRVSHSTG